MSFKNTVKVIVTASALSVPAFFSGNAFAIPGCGACVVGAEPASHTFVNSSTVCTTCHAAPAPAPVVTTKPVVTPDPVVIADPVVKPDPVVTINPVVKPDPVVIADPVVKPVHVATVDHTSGGRNSHSTGGSHTEGGMHGLSDDHRKLTGSVASANKRSNSDKRHQRSDD